jgi:hypothetical protein
MAEPTLPYTLTNGMTANASEVQANDQALLDGITDGTKDIEVAALTTTGNVTLGNSAADLVTWNASIASHILPSANTTYDLGSSTLGYRSAYIGGSSTYTCRIIGGTQAGSFSLTLPTALPASTAYLQVSSAGAMSTRVAIAPTVQKFTSTGSTSGYVFTISTSSTVAVGDTYTNNANTYTVLAALSAQTGQVLFCSGASAPQSSGNLARATGAGTATIAFTQAAALATYTLPASVLYINVRMVGGGGGGAAAATNSGASGTASFFGPSLLSAGGGTGGTATAGAGGAGGTASLGTGPIGVAFTGSSGGEGSTSTAGYGADGGASPFGGASSGNGGAAVANTGSGGGGGASSTNGGAGGGAGGYVDAVIGSPAATYVYCVGTGGAGGAAGGNPGGNGAAGIILVTEHYQ